MTTSLLTTKLFIPPPRPELVPRPLLINQLNKGLYHNLTLISAPAGFGKTTLACDWVEQLRLDTLKENQNNYGIAWLSLDEDDNDISRFLGYFITALQTINIDIGQKAQTVFQSQQQLLVDQILVTLVNDITQLLESPSEQSNKEIVLILDDYHVIEEPTIHNAIEYLLEHQPPQLHLVILTRTDPPLPLSRLRARNQMVEIRGNNLHFTVKEIDVFLNEIMKLGLAPNEIALLEARTEGWIAGLQLAAISLQNQTNRHEFIQAFSGDDRFVFDYLLDEVLLRQPKDVRTFLLQTAVLERMCGPLCDTVINLPDGESSLDGQDFLEYLDQANLFIVPLDNQRKWYRYQHLFSEVLLYRLRKTEFDKIRELHLRASQWFARQGYHDEALYHALAGEDLEKATQIVEQNALDLLVHSRLTRLKKWYESLPEDLVHSRPRLCILQGWLHILIGTVEDANQCVRESEQLLKSTPPQEKAEEQDIRSFITCLKARIALKNGELGKANEFANQTLDYIQKRTPLHAHIAVIKGLVAYREGDLETADQTLREAVTIAQDYDHRFMTVEATIWLGYIKTLQGQLHQAIRLYRDALQLANLNEKQKLPIAGSAYIGIALVELERNNLEVAENILIDSYDLCNLFGNPQPWHVALALVKYTQGNHVDAQNEFQIAEQLEKGSEVAFAKLNLDNERVRFWLSPMENNLAKAVQWTEDSGLKAFDMPSFSHRTDYIMLARVLLAQDEMGKTSELLIRLRDDAESGGRKGDLIEILALQALSLYAQGESDQAINILEQALTLAEPEGYIRIFVDEGPSMASLLYEALKRSILPDYISKLLAAFPVDESEISVPLKSQSTRSKLVEPLSDREIEVLQLISEGLTNNEIASKLFLSTNTIKSHSRNIYAKLDVNNRTQALIKARALGILTST